MWIAALWGLVCLLWRELPQGPQTHQGNHQSALYSFLIPHMLSAKPAQGSVNSNHQKLRAGRSLRRLLQSPKLETRNQAERGEVTCPHSAREQGAR